MSEIPWYIGRYDRRNYRSYLKVVARGTKNDWYALDNPKKMFPRTGEVELIGSDSLQLRQGDWIVFQVGVGTRNKVVLAKHPRRIYPYYDLSSEESLLALRRRLSFDGIDMDTEGEPGQWAIRFGPEALILTNLADSKSGRLTLSRNQNVPEYNFNESGVIAVSGMSKGGKAFYMPNVDALPCRTHDWTPDKQYIENVVQLISRTDSTTEIIASWLRKHSEDQNGILKSGVDDLLAAAQALRSGELAKKLEEEHSLARQFTEIALNDGSIAALLERQIQNIVEEERDALRAEQQKAIDNEFLSERLRLRSIIEDETQTLLSTKKSEIEQMLAQFRQSEKEKLNAELAEKRENTEQKLRQEKTALEKEIAHLKDVGADLSNQNERRRLTLVSLASEHEKSSVSLLNAKELAVQAEAELERMNVAILEKARQMAYSAIPAVRTSAETKVIVCLVLGRIVSENRLLTPDGKILMEQFIALMLAGEFPLLYGPKTQDFLAIAESLISSGRSIRQIADPTMLSYEDLWVRAGNNLATPLYQGLLLSDASRPRTILAVIEQVERSGSRFWLPALKNRLRGGDFSRRFFLCGTIENEDCEEAEKMKEEHIRLQVKNAVIQNAVALSPWHLSIENFSELDPGTAPQGSLPDKLIIANKMSGGRLNIVNTLRATRTALEVASFDDENDAIRQKRLVDLFADLQNNQLCAQ